MLKLPLSVLAACLTLCIGNSPMFAQSPASVDPQQLQFFESKVRPILVKQCGECHSSQAKKIKGGLTLDSRSGWIKGGDSGPAIVPGAPEKSILFKAINYQSENLKMPPAGKLSAQEIAVLGEWIRRGAHGPEKDATGAAAAPMDVEKGKQFWSFRPLVDVVVPQPKDKAWGATALDAFILARLEKEGLRPVADADAETLLRRLTFDLIGLPPQPDDIVQFVKAYGVDPQKAVTQAADRLLASPPFGVQWARHWLDLARYADTNGSDENWPYADAWRYRNWVIDAVNQDKPFAQFLTEQLAGDLLGAKDTAQRDSNVIATGFLQLGPKTLAQYDRAQLKMDVIDEQIDTLGRAVLGLTLGCARCHDHKFDPVPTRDYYALAGIFSSTQTLDGPMRTPGDVITDWMKRGLGEGGDDKLRAYKQLKFTIYKLETKWHDQRRKLAKLEKQLAQDKTSALAQEVEAARQAFAKLTQEKQQFDDSRPPMAMAVREATVPCDERIRIRGEVHNPAVAVPRGFLQVLAFPDQPTPSDKQSGRLELAQWLTSPMNPLPARVAVNRIWQHLFGSGLVKSVDNFGVRGEPPSHPELLDYLARRFLDEGGSTKQLIRLIVTSRVYRLSSRQDSKALAADPENRLLWRMNRRRLTPEQMRDGILAAAGQLDPGRGQAVVAHLQLRAIIGDEHVVPDSKLRSIYLPVIRNQLLDVFEVFNFTDPQVPTGTRPSTIVAPQALYLMNSPFIRKTSQTMGQDLARQRSGMATADLVRLAYRRILNRQPTEREEQLLLDYMDSVGTLELPEQMGRLCHALFASTPYEFLD
jgi:hypothetical protein